MNENRKINLVNSIIKSLTIDPSPKDLIGWVEHLVKNNSEYIRVKNHQTVFLSKNLDNQQFAIAGVGRYLGIKIHVSIGEILGSIDYMGEVLHTEKLTPDKDYETMPFTEIFDHANRMAEELRRMLPAEFLPVPFVGGVKSITLKKEPQEVVNFYLPEVEIFGSSQNYTMFAAPHLAEQVPLPRDENVSGTRAKPVYTTPFDEPTKENYFTAMAEILKKMAEGELQKIVYSMKRTIEPSDDFDITSYARYLLENFYQEYFYYFQQGSNAYWAGISPEVILKQKGRLAITEPLAGTRKKSETDTDLEAIKKDLTNTPKDRSEHEFAARFMFEQLSKADIGEVKKGQNITLLETPYTFHIKSEMSVKLKETATVFDFIRAIYPPATIWGIPVDVTEKVLKRAEPFEREYYTGLYGFWTFAETANIALVIRSAKIEDKNVSFYAGGGIVSSSDTQAEYAEAENKMRPLLSYFSESKL